MVEKDEQNTKRRDNPRFVDKSKKNMSKVVQRDLDDVSRLSTIIPEVIKMKVGSAIMAFSRLEMSATNFLWDILGLEIDDGKLLFRMDTKDRFVMAKKLSERYGMPLHGNKQTTAEAWSTIDKIIEARNKMAHGVWHMIDGEMPIVVSYRIAVEPGRVNSEAFDADRIDSVTGACINISRLFDELCAQLASLPSRPVRQDLKTTTNHPPHPAPQR